MRPRNSAVAILRLAPALILAVTVAPALQAQDSVIVINPDAPAVTPSVGRTLPAEVLDEAVQRFNDTTTIRFISDNFTRR